MLIEQVEVQFTLLKEAGDVVRIPVEVVDLFQDLWFELVVGSNIPGDELPRCWRSGCLWGCWMVR